MSLQTLCADSLLDALGEKPDLIQQLVGERAIERITKTVRKKQKKIAEKKMTEYVSQELTILIPLMVGDIIDFGMGENTPFFMTTTYSGVDRKIRDHAWVIAQNTVKQMRCHFADLNRRY